MSLCFQVFSPIYPKNFGELPDYEGKRKESPGVVLFPLLTLYRKWCIIILSAMLLIIPHSFFAEGMV